MVVKNEWERKGTEFEWEPVPSQLQVLDEEVEKAMIDHRDGNYSRIYVSNRPGTITIYILEYTQGNVLAEYYNNTSWTGDVQYSSYHPEINFDWGQGDIYPNVKDQVWVQFYFRFYTTKSGIYTFTVGFNDDVNFTINSDLLISGTSQGI